MFSNNYFKLDEKQMKIYKQIQFIYNEYLYTPRHEPIDMNALFSDLKLLGKFIYVVAYGKKKTTSSSSSKVLARGIKTRKNTINKSSSSILFNRIPLVKRFKKPFFLILKIKIYTNCINEGF